MPVVSDLRGWRSRSLIVAAIGLSFMAGCDEKPSVRRWREFASLPRWSIDSSASATIGSVGQGAEHELDYVRAATFLTDGTIAVADQGRARILIYSQAGRLLRSIGGHAQARAQFELLVGISAWPDGLVAYDAALRRLCWFTLTDHMLGCINVPEGRRVVPPLVLARRDSAWLVLGPDHSARLGLVRDTAVLTVVTRAGFMRALRTVSGSERWSEASSNGAISSETDFTHRRFLASGRDSVVVTAVTDSAIIKRVDLSGRVLRQVRWSEPMIRVNAAVISEYVSRFSELSPARRVELRHRLLLRRTPPTLPVIGRMLVADDGSIWVRPHTLHPLDLAEWIVFNKDLLPVGRAVLPSGILDIASGQVLVAKNDPAGRPILSLHRITYAAKGQPDGL